MCASGVLGCSYASGDGGGRARTRADVARGAQSRGPITPEGFVALDDGLAVSPWRRLFSADLALLRAVSDLSSVGMRCSSREG